MTTSKWAGVVFAAAIVAMPIGRADAARLITDATLDGQHNISIAPGGSFVLTAMLTVEAVGTNTNNDWESTGWAVSPVVPGSLTCDASANFNLTPGNIFPIELTHSFMITAPMTPAIYDAYFVAYDDNSCAGSGFFASNLFRGGRVVVEGCGNGIVEEGEACDDGDANGTADSCCASTCRIDEACTLSCDDTLAASIFRAGGPSFGEADTFAITNDSSDGITITSVQIRLPANTQFDTASIIPLVFAPFQQGAGAVATGIVSPANGGVADDSFIIDLVFSDFDPGESFEFSIDTDFDSPVTGISIPTGAQLAGTLVTVEFSDGSSTITGVGTLEDAGGFDNVGTVTRRTSAFPNCPRPAPAASTAGLLLLVAALCTVAALRFRVEA